MIIDVIEQQLSGNTFKSTGTSRSPFTGREASGFLSHVLGSRPSQSVITNGTASAACEPVTMTCAIGTDSPYASVYPHFPFMFTPVARRYHRVRCALSFPTLESKVQMVTLRLAVMVVLAPMSHCRRVYTTFFLPNGSKGSR